MRRWKRGADRALRAVTGSASRTARRGEVVVQTYRGYGSDSHLFIAGRVFREPSGQETDGQSQNGKLEKIWRLMRRWGLDGAELTVRFDGAETTVQTDRDGYFHADLALPSPPPPDRRWHQVSVRLTRPTTIEVEGDVFVPKAGCRFVVISDIDDTVMETGVANKLLMMRRLFVDRADSRTAFPGMATFLQALHRGRAGDEGNPMIYVSRAPWAIYGVLERFFHLHEIPVGPILFLREWGLTLQQPLPRRDKEHKRDVIHQIATHYEALPIILIGDSGQHDPELYTEIVKAFPERVSAIYIRDVTADRARRDAIDNMASELEPLGTPLIQADDTLAMAEHAAEHGMIAESAVREIGEASLVFEA